MNITAFRNLSAPSKFLPALIALGVNAIFFWGAVRVTSVPPPERVSRMSAAGLAGVVLQHGSASAVALAWELQLLATHAKAGG